MAGFASPAAVGWENPTPYIIGLAIEIPAIAVGIGASIFPGVDPKGELCCSETCFGMEAPAGLTSYDYARLMYGVKLVFLSGYWLFLVGWFIMLVLSFLFYS